MDKTITLTSDDICIITLALLDKAMNIKNSAKICGITLSSQTLNKLASMQELVNKIIAKDEDIYISYDGEVDTSRPYDDEDEEEEEEEE